MTLLSTLPTPEWHDVSYYKHNNQYLILECNDGWATTNISYRFVIASFITKKIRFIQRHSYTDGYPENSKFSMLLFEGKTWEKVDIKAQ
ncbi:hypothetical protein [Mucilaginibacter sp. CSA2-8R]|uniref:hypothetical protein n=1 Tax=Mucilaginibacter sp. CSA2-8R TaxID=3141542 RepID=UPI00315D5DCE